MSVIEGAGVTIEWLHETLQKATDSKSKLSKWEVGRVGVGQGYASKMYSVTFDWENKGKLPAAVVLKIIDFTEAKKLFDNPEMEKYMESMMAMAHDHECAAYEILSEEGVPVPRCYYSKPYTAETGMIIIDYLADGTLVNFVDGFSLKQVMSVADNLAKLHAKSLTVEGFEKKFDMDRMKSTFEAMMAPFTKDIEEKIKPQFPNFYREVCEPLTKNYDPKDVFALVFDAAERIGVPNVLVHGDFWPNNMMFKKDNNGRPSDDLLAFIDLQISHPGSCMEDLSVALNMSCSTDLRRKHGADVINYYWERLNHYTNGKSGFTKEKVWAAYKDVELRAVFFMVIAIGIFTRMPELDKAGKGNREENLNVMLRRSQAAVHDYLPDLVKDVC